AHASDAQRPRPGSPLALDSPRMGKRSACAVPLAAAALFLAASRCLSQDAIGLEQALAEARTANLRLPLPAFEVQVLRARRSEAVAERWMKVAVEGGFIYAPFYSHGYDPALSNLGEARIQVAARQPIYAGGSLR